MTGLLGKKLGMTSIFDDAGQVIPCTVIEAGPCFVTQIKTVDRDGYEAVQIGFEERKERRGDKAAARALRSCERETLACCAGVPRQWRQRRPARPGNQGRSGLHQGRHRQGGGDVERQGFSGRGKAAPFRWRLPDARPERSRAGAGIHRIILVSFARVPWAAYGGT